MNKLPENVIEAIKTNKYFLSTHFKTRQIERNLKFINIKECLINGEVIEYIKDSIYGEKFLVYCKCDNLVFHIPINFKKGTVILITIYVPDEENFKKDKKTRIKKKK